MIDWFNMQIMIFYLNILVLFSSTIISTFLNQAKVKWQQIKPITKINKWKKENINEVLFYEKCIKLKKK